MEVEGVFVGSSIENNNPSADPKRRTSPAERKAMRRFIGSVVRRMAPAHLTILSFKNPEMTCLEGITTRRISIINALTFRFSLIWLNLVRNESSPRVQMSATAASGACWGSLEIASNGAQRQRRRNSSDALGTTKGRIWRYTRAKDGATSGSSESSEMIAVNTGRIARLARIVVSQVLVDFGSCEEIISASSRQ